MRLHARLVRSLQPTRQTHSQTKATRQTHSQQHRRNPLGVKGGRTGQPDIDSGRRHTLSGLLRHNGAADHGREHRRIEHEETEAGYFL